MKINDLKISKNGVMSLLLAGSLAFTLVGCSSSKGSSEVSSNSTSISSVSSSSSSESIISKNIEESDTAVEAALGIMIEGADKLAESSDKAKETEAYKEAKEESMQNFITLSEFLRGETEIAGKTVDEVSDDTKERAEEALYEIDSDLERIYPNYKEELKEKGLELMDWLEDKGTDLAAKGYDKYQELKQKTLEKTKSNK